MRIKPLRDLILLGIISEESQSKTKSGIILALWEKQSSLVRNIYPFRAKVIALGRGIELNDGSLMPFPVKVGDEVAFERFGATKLVEDEKEYLIISIKDIIGVINEV